MREFTANEKQQRRAKIRDHRNRRFWGAKSDSPLAKYLTLAIILCAVAVNLFIFLRFQRIGHEQFYLLVITVIALLDHLADEFAKQGWKRRLLKITEWVLIILAFSYVAYQVWIRFADKLSATLVGG